MNRLARFCSAATLALTALVAAPAVLADPGPSGLHVAAHIPGPDGGWDYASFDTGHRRLYVAHGTQVMAVDVDTGKVTADFAAGDHLHAVVPVPGTDLVVTTNSGDNTARVISTIDGKLIASVPGPKDSDSAIYDPYNGDVVVIGGDSAVITLVDPKAAKAVATITLDGALEFPALDEGGRLYVNNEEKNEIDVVDLAAGKLVTRYPLNGCQHPSGLAYVVGGRLVSACANGVAKILDAATGKDIASPAIGAGPDAVVYDPVRKLAMIPTGRAGALAVIALSGPGDNTVVDTVPTQIGARTGAVDTKTGKVYLPTAEYNLPVPAGQRPTTKPGTFQVLVLDR